MFESLVKGLADYQVVLEPDQNTPEWWAGAPSVCRSPAGDFYLAVRMREGNSRRGRRGYEIRILRSSDGARFEAINHLRREDGGYLVFERPALVRVPASGQYRLYGCTELEQGWGIVKFADVDDPADLDVRTGQVVLQAEYEDDGFAHVVGYKDPFIMWDGAMWHMFVIGYDRVERLWHFVSDDGIGWSPASPDPVLGNQGWHNFFTRPASVVPLGVGYLFVYEGSNVNWRDPVYNIATGLAYSPDLQTVIDLTPDAPLLQSTTPGRYFTWRYSHWMVVGDEMYVYFEAARPNGTNETRLGIVKLNHAL